MIVVFLGERIIVDSAGSGGAVATQHAAWRADKEV